MTLEYNFGPELVDALPPWMLNHPDIATAYLNEIIEMGGTSNTNAANLALEEIRMAPEYREMYDRAFVGNRREDGSLRMEEGTYFAEVSDMRSYVKAVGLDPDVFQDKYGEMIGGDTYAQEFGTRVNAIYAAVIGGVPETMAWYSDNFDIEMSEAAIVGSMLSPELGDALLSGRITSAQIGGEAAARGFDIDRTFAEMLEGAGADRDAAKRFFGEAQALLPSLQVMAARHADPADEFDLNDLADLSFFDDPVQRGRMNRLMAQEASTFTGGAEIEYLRSKSGGVTGLMDV